MGQRVKRKEERAKGAPGLRSASLEAEAKAQKTKGAIWDGGQGMAQRADDRWQMTDGRGHGAERKAYGAERIEHGAPVERQAWGRE